MLKEITELLLAIAAALKIKEEIEKWRNRLKIENVTVKYYGQELIQEWNTQAHVYELLFTIANASAKKAENVMYNITLEWPSLGDESGEINTSIYNSPTFNLITKATFAPLIIKTDLKSYMIITNKYIQAVTPFSKKVAITIRVTSSTHRGATYTKPLIDILKKHEYMSS